LSKYLVKEKLVIQLFLLLEKLSKKLVLKNPKWKKYDYGLKILPR
jgi:hypothetical protein